jgi:hypothetical protein
LSDYPICSYIFRISSVLHIFWFGCRVVFSCLVCFDLCICRCLMTHHIDYVSCVRLYLAQREHVLNPNVRPRQKLTNNDNIAMDFGLRVAAGKSSQSVLAGPSLDSSCSHPGVAKIFLDVVRLGCDSDVDK